MNGELLTEIKGNGEMEGIFWGKLSDRGQINSEFEVEEFDFNVTNNGISEPQYLKVRGTKYTLADYYLWCRLTHIKLIQDHLLSEGIK